MTILGSVPKAFSFGRPSFRRKKKTNGKQNAVDENMPPTDTPQTSSHSTSRCDSPLADSTEDAAAELRVRAARGAEEACIHSPGFSLREDVIEGCLEALTSPPPPPTSPDLFSPTLADAERLVTEALAATMCSPTLEEAERLVSLELNEHGPRNDITCESCEEEAPMLSSSCSSPSKLVSPINMRIILETELHVVEEAEQQLKKAPPPAFALAQQSPRQAELQSVPEAELQSVPEAELQSVPEAELQSVPEAELQSVPEAELQSVPEAELQSVPEAELQSVPEAELQSVPDEAVVRTPVMTDAHIAEPWRLLMYTPSLWLFIAVLVAAFVSVWTAEPEAPPALSPPATHSPKINAVVAAQTLSALLPPAWTAAAATAKDKIAALGVVARAASAPAAEALVAAALHGRFEATKLANYTAVKTTEVRASIGKAAAALKVEVLLARISLELALEQGREAAGQASTKAANAVAHHTAAIHKAIQKSRPLKLAFPVPPPAQMLRRALMQPLRLELDMITSVLRSLGFGIREEELRKM